MKTVKENHSPVYNQPIKTLFYILFKESISRIMNILTNFVNSAILQNFRNFIISCFN